MLRTEVRMDTAYNKLGSCEQRPMFRDGTVLLQAPWHRLPIPHWDQTRQMTTRTLKPICYPSCQQRRLHKLILPQNSQDVEQPPACRQPSTRPAPRCSNIVSIRQSVSVLVYTLPCYITMHKLRYMRLLSAIKVTHNQVQHDRHVVSFGPQYSYMVGSGLDPQ